MGQGQGRELPFDVGATYNCLLGKTIWSVHTGRRKSNGEAVTVFMFDFTGRSEDEIKLAQSAHLRLKTLRHPNILRYIDGVELPSCIYAVTEDVCPLEDHLSTREGYSEFATKWGFHQIIKAISFLNIDCGLVHRNICLSSIFVDEAGEWKLGGVEFMHPFGDSHAPRKCLESLQRYDPPEVNKSAVTRRMEKCRSTDIWGLGCLVWEVFNGPLPQVSSLRNTSKIPKSLLSHYCEFVSANPKSRPNPTVLLGSLREHGGYLSNPFVSIALRIEELQIMEASQRNEFFTELNKSLDSFPENFAKRKILPQLLNAFEFGGAGSAVLAPLFKLSRLLDNAEYQKKIVPCVVKLFSSTDRATRLNLLQQLEHFIDHLQPSTVNDQIFPHVSSGFTDTIPALREQTIKSMVLIAPKLSESTINSQLLKYFAKCQLDEMPGIRTNTNICLGKIASYLSPTTRQKVLVSAFLRSLKDPFPPARCAGISSMAATHAYYTTSDVATRLLPALCTMTVDKEKTVRDQAFQVIKLFLGKLEKLSEDPEAAAQQQKSEAAASSWTGWAMSSLTSKFYKPPSGNVTPSTTATPSTSSSTVTGGSKERGSQKPEEPAAARDRQLPEKKGEGHREEGWDEEEWEDFDTPPADTQPRWEGEEDEGEGSDMEGWEDDGWGVLESSIGPERGVPTQDERTATVSSGADFFDTFQSTSRTKNKADDFFESFGATASGSKGRKERSPPPVSPTLFGGKKEDKKEEDSWGDWGAEVLPNRPAQKKVMSSRSASGALKLGTGTARKEPPMFTMGSESSRAVASTSDTKTGGGTSRGGTGEGWDFGSDWGSFDSPSSATAMDDTGGLSRQELLQKRKEERRLKQQAAREKRAAGASLKPSGLGAVKKD